MAGPDFWRDLADEFWAVHDSQQPLRAEWSCTTKAGEAPPKTAQWRLVGSPGTESGTRRFEALASRAGIEVDLTVEPLTAWLEVVKREGLTVVARDLAGTIRDVCRASADCCKILEVRALKAERLVRQELPNAQVIETIGVQLDRLREESRLTIEKLAEALQVDRRSVERHLSGETKPRIGNIGAYERVFSKSLGRKVVISTMPVKRR